MKILSLTLAAALLCGACTSKNLASSVAAFDQSVATAVDLHNKQLDRVVSLHDTALREQLAAENAQLITTGCDALLIAYSPALAAECVIVKDIGDRAEPIDANPVRVDRLKALASALARYAASLALLAGDFKKDEKAFSDAVGSLAANIGNLQGQIERAGGAAVVDKKSLGALAGLAAEAGKLYFEHRRWKVLRETIAAAHPLVVGATEILSEADSAARTAILAQTVAGNLNDAELNMAQVARGSPSASQVKAAQKKVFDAHREYLQAASLLSSFGGVREAHEAMLNATQSGLDTEDLITLAEKLTALAGKVDAAIEAFDEN